ncbi:rhomboid family intramembrane serine protease [Parvularcula marina]|uniref:Rhomboid family intramembrane serine protease n=1 Tax=Parvularcula marina TaxID=2292771 RepID=A0A371RG77_9PROT|nr:rhomboid family intramembrane serine protease [Parvularcula marina]RFB04473.1 rhomboid family intramembrane serine protease [Parvularcula marina]
MGIEFADAPLAYALLVMMLGASLYGLMADQSFVMTGLFDMGAIRKGGQWWRFVTSAFLHADLGHLIINGLTFYFFAPAVEYLFGTERFFIIAMGSQLGAMAFTYYRKRTDMSYRALGMSGALSGIVLAFCVVRPMTDIYLFFVVPLPALVVGIGYVAYSALAMGGPGRIGHEAHLGGAVTGAVIALLMALG